MQSATPLAPNPTGSCRTFTDALNIGDLERASACFARDGSLVTPDGTAIHGRERIREILTQMIIRRTEIRIELSSSIDAGEVKLFHQRWWIRSGNGEESFERAHDAVLVLRRIEETWKISIAAPWGYRRSYD